MPSRRGLGAAGRGRWLDRAALTVAAAVAVAGAAGCGVGPQRSPENLSRSAVPYGLLQASSSPAAAVAVAQVARTIYLVRGDQLVAATATVPVPGRIDQTVRTLLSGVDPAQSAAGLRSAIPDGTHLLSFDLAGRVANLDLSPTFTTARSADQILAVAQLVFTATTTSTVTAVTFSVAGKPIELPSPDGALTAGPVTRALYRPLLAP